MIETTETAPVRSCSELSRVLGEPLAGSAPVAAGWLCIERSGPWGRKAVTQSGLDPAVAETLEDRGAAGGVRVGLIKRPGRQDGSAASTVLIASTLPGASWLVRAQIHDPADLLDLDLGAVAAGVRPDLGEPVDAPVVLVCTNAKRDQCCAVHGRALAVELAAAGVDVWESSHLGGHRFAPTGVILPTGYAYGRWDSAGATSALAAAADGRVTVDGCRGRSTWSRPGQIAELTVRSAIGEDDAGALTVIGDGKGAGDAVVVRHRDGRSWAVEIGTASLGPEVTDPCAGKTITPTGATAGPPVPIAGRR